MTQSLPPKSIVLYADDDPDDLQLVEDAFAQYANNVEVVAVTDGAEALAFLDQLPPLAPLPCLIILDVNMPRINGKETLLRIKATERFKDIPVILFTTSSLPHDRAFAQKHEAGFITKPLEMRQMEMIADQFIEHCAEEVKKKIRRQLRWFCFLHVRGFSFFTIV